MNRARARARVAGAPTLQRGDSLPPGRYWFDAFGEKIPIAEAWLKAQAASKRARVLRTETTGDERGTWFLFEVLPPGPMPWPELELGNPTIATPDIQSRQDTVKRPPPEPAFDWSVFTPIAASGWLPLGVFLGVLWALGGKQR